MEKDNNIKEILDSEQTESQLNLETLSGFGEGFDINDVHFPPPSTAVLSLLEISDNPFLEGREDMTLEEIIKTLYILKHRENAIKPIKRFVRAERVLEKYKENANETPAHFGELLKASQNIQDYYDEFDRKCHAFAQKLGCFNMQAVMTQIRDYLYECMGGFGMLPEKNGPRSKKKDTLTGNGSPG